MTYSEILFFVLLVIILFLLIRGGSPYAYITPLIINHFCTLSCLGRIFYRPEWQGIFFIYFK